MDGDVRLLERPDSQRVLLGRAVLASLRRRGGAAVDAPLPERPVMLTEVRQDPDRLAAYARVCGFTLREAVPATWIHVLAFPLHVHLMSAPDFPYAPFGTVHVENAITVVRPVRVEERLALSCRVANQRPHRRGVLFDMVADAYVADELVWHGVSTYLARLAQGGGAPAGSAREGSGSVGESGVVEPPAGGEGEGSSEPTVAEMPPVVAVWRLPADLGRRYAAVSQDVNPIHLSAPTARLFGFPTAIAHGMWTAARALAAVENRLPATFHADVRFAKPVRLPGRVDFRAEAVHGGQAVAVTSGDEPRVHLTGRFVGTAG